MTCRETMSLLEAYIDRELPASQATSLAAHLDQCAACRMDYQKSIKLREALTSLPVPDPGDEYFAETNRLILARTVDRLDRDMERIPVTEETVWYRRSLARSMVAFAASAVLMITALILGTGHRDRIAQVEGNISMFAVSSLEGVTGSDEKPILTADERMALTVSTTTLGAPGSLGRFAAVQEMVGGR